MPVVLRVLCRSWLACDGPQSGPLRSVGLRLLNLANRLVQPVLHTVPVLPEQLHRMHSAIGSIAAGQRFGGAIQVAPPADAFRVAGVGGEFLGHSVHSRKWGAEPKLCLPALSALIEIKAGCVCGKVSTYRFCDRHVIAKVGPSSITDWR